MILLLCYVGDLGVYICDPAAGEVITLDLLCNGIADCLSGEDETTSICDSKL